MILATAAVAVFLQQAGHIASYAMVRGEVLSWAMADLDGDGDRDLLLATLTPDGQRVIRVHNQQQAVVFDAEPAVEIPVPRAVVSWGVGNFLDGEGDAGAEIVFLARDAVWLRPHEGRLKRLHDAAMLLDMPASDALPRWRPVIDVDGDGLDEIALVTSDGFRVIDASGELRLEVLMRPVFGRVPTASGAFLGGAVRATLSSQELSDLVVPNEEAGVLEPPPALYAEASMPRPVFVDADGDGRVDLSWYADGAMHVRFQAADGSYPEDNAIALELPEEDAFQNGYLAWRDAGGGAAADLLLNRTDRETVSFSSDWQVMVWLDPAISGALPDPDAFLKVEAGYVRVHVGDWNGDGRRDLGVSAWSVDAGLLAGATASMSHDLTLYPAVGEGWSLRPALAHDREYRLDDVSAFRDLDALVPDATGDGFPDLLESDENGVLEIRRFLAEGGPLRVKSDPEFRISVDALAAEVIVEDLNGDGISDFLVAKPEMWQVHLSYRM